MRRPEGATWLKIETAMKTMDKICSKGWLVWQLNVDWHSVSAVLEELIRQGKVEVLETTTKSKFYRWKRAG